MSTETEGKVRNRRKHPEARIIPTGVHTLFVIPTVVHYGSRGPGVRSRGPSVEVDAHLGPGGGNGAEKKKRRVSTEMEGKIGNRREDPG